MLWISHRSGSLSSGGELDQCPSNLLEFDDDCAINFDLGYHKAYRVMRKHKLM
jgi:hypothetical protein